MFNSSTVIGYSICLNIHASIRVGSLTIRRSLSLQANVLSQELLPHIQVDRHRVEALEECELRSEYAAVPFAPGLSLWHRVQPILRELKPELSLILLR